MSDAGGSESGAQGTRKKSTSKMGSDQSAQAESQIRNLDNTVKRLHQQRASIRKQMAEDEKELAWVNSEIKAWEEKRRRVMQTKQNHLDQESIIKRTTAESRHKLNNELLAEAQSVMAAAKKSLRALEKKEYVPKHKVTMK